MLRDRLDAFANQRRRFGYRGLLILLRGDDVMINRKKTQRFTVREAWQLGGGEAVPRAQLSR